MLYSELEAYFIERFGELLNKKTPDSYRVRYHNSLSILQEFHELIEGWHMPEGQVSGISISLN